MLSARIWSRVTAWRSHIAVVEGVKGVSSRWGPGRDRIVAVEDCERFDRRTRPDRADSSVSHVEACGETQPLRW